MKIQDFKNAAKEAVRQIGSHFTNLHGTRQAGPGSASNAPTFNRRPANENGQLPLPRYGFPTTMPSHTTQTNGAGSDFHRSSATTAVRPEVNQQGGLGQSGFQDIPESYYQNILGSVPPLPLRPSGNSNGSSYLQSVAPSSVANQGNIPHAIANGPQTNNSTGASNAGVKEHIMMFEQRGQNSIAPKPNFSSGSRIHPFASAAVSNQVPSSGIAGIIGASQGNGGNAGTTVFNNSNVFTRYPADVPLGANGVQTRIAELERRGLNSAPLQGNPTVIARNNAANAGSSNRVQPQDPRDFVLQPPPMPNLLGSSAVQPFNSPQPVQPVNNPNLFNSAPSFNSAPHLDNPFLHQAEVNRLLAGRAHQVIEVPFGTPLGMKVNETGATVVAGFQTPDVIDFNRFPVGVSVFGPMEYRPQQVQGANAQPTPPNPEDHIIHTRL